jgi:hypothetical protein
MSRARSVADLGNQNVLTVSATDGNINVGTGVTIENTGEAQFSGIVTAQSIDTRNLLGDVSIGGVLTYEDVTSVDSIGIVTARSDVIVGGGLSVTGVSTFVGLSTFNNGLIVVSGVSTLGNTVIGGGTTELVVTGDARVTGILTVGTASFTINGAVEYPTIRPTLDLNFAATKTLDRRITFTRDGVGTYVDELGIIRYASSNVPRFDHDPVTGESLGLLIEESRTNNAVYTSEFDNAAYNKLNSTVVANQVVAPDGTTTADLLYPNSSGTGRGLEDILTLSSTGVYTTSVYVKAAGLSWVQLYAVNGGQRAFFNISTGTKGSELGGGSLIDWDIIDAGNGWYRIYVTYDLTSIASAEYFYIYLVDGDSNTSVTANGTDGVYVWGLQIEEGSFPTSYIPTSGTAVTRGADLATINGTNFTDFYNQTEGTLFGEFTIKDSTFSSAAIANINQEPSSSYAYSIMFVEVGTTNGYFGRTFKNSSGVNLSNASSVANLLHPSTTPQKVTFGYTTVSGGELRSYWNGNYVNSSTDLSKVPTTLTNMRIGRGWSGTSANNIINAHIRKLSYYNKRLPNAQLQGLTAS